MVPALMLAIPVLAAAQTPAATPAGAPASEPSPAPTPDVVTSEMPTLTDADPVPAAPTGDPEWDAGARSSGMLLGLRGGFHAFEPAGFADGGFALEVVAAMPLFGPFYGALSAGYHTGATPAGHDEPDPKKRLFDAQYGALEGQYRHNVGRLNVIGGVGIGVLTATSAAVTLSDGSPAQTSGTGALLHVGTGVFYPVGRMGVVGGLKYAFAPVAFDETGETLGMGGLTIAAGLDFAF